MKRRGKSKATPASVADQKAELMGMFPGEPGLREDDDDLSPLLEKRKQRNKVMERSELNALAHRVVMERLEGIPRPQRDGSLPPGYALWTNSEK
ncbi:MAG: hypothetical protein ABJI23_06930, partial [Marinobacter sp.]|uniref:hypothetical protein n=1 Tax=Marinobacter sp. TaxID=50741 RepID=UPI003299527D